MQWTKWIIRLLISPIFNKSRDKYGYLYLSNNFCAKAVFPVCETPAIKMTIVFLLKIVIMHLLRQKCINTQFKFFILISACEIVKQSISCFNFILPLKQCMNSRCNKPLQVINCILFSGQSVLFSPFAHAIQNWNQ